MIPGYQMAGYGWYEEYLKSEEWTRKKAGITRRYPNSKYCWICDSTKWINLHHENYDTIPKERFLKDVFWLCTSCHAMVHILKTGAKIDLLAEGYQLELGKRRKELRREYVFSYVRATTIIPFLKRWAYRKLW